MPGSFHLSFFVFRHFWRRSYKNQLSFSGKDSTADFFIVRHLRKTKMKWNTHMSSKTENYRFVLIFIFMNFIFALFFYRCQNFLCWSKVLWSDQKLNCIYCRSNRFLLTHKLNLLNGNHLLVWRKNFRSGTTCKSIFGLAQKIWTSPKYFVTRQGIRSLL